MSKRHNVQEIAEVLIDKMDDLQRLGKSIDQSSRRVIQVDTKELEQILEDNRNKNRAILHKIESLQKKNATRLPNWVIAVVCFLFFSLIVFTAYLFNRAEDYSQNRPYSEAQLD